MHKPSKMGKHYVAEEVNSRYRWPDYPSLDYSKLTEYALHVYSRLQEPDKKGFQSLDVGRRLDIGIAPDGGQFVVDELTRWYGAHQFAVQTQSMPGDRICRAYAKAFAETTYIKPRNAEIEEPATIGRETSTGNRMRTVQEVTEPSVRARKPERWWRGV
jgi:hypothetical protein